jgi:hypothetical protein
MLNTLAATIASWAAVVENTPGLEDGLMVLHLGTLALGGGLAILADGLTLWAWRGTAERRAQHMTRLRAWHAPIVLGLAGCCATGVLLAAADFDEFARSAVMGVKLVLLALLVVNGLVMLWAERGRSTADGTRLRQANWGFLRGSAVASAVLWVTIALTGTQL